MHDMPFHSMEECQQVELIETPLKAVRFLTNSKIVEESFLGIRVLALYNPIKCLDEGEDSNYS